jgi:broad specificity phosphatase PhoE
VRPKRIFLVRHGQSKEDIDKEEYEKLPDYEIGLTSIGREQSTEVGKRLAEKLKSKRVYFFVSPGARNRETFECIIKQLPDMEYRIFEEPLIRKQDWGCFPIKDRKNIEEERYKSGVLYYRFPNGESGGDVFARIVQFLKRLECEYEKKNFPKDIVIITHGLELRLFLMGLFQWSVEEFETLAGPCNGYIATVNFCATGYILEEPYPSYPGRVSRLGRPTYPFDNKPRRK